MTSFTNRNAEIAPVDGKTVFCDLSINCGHSPTAAEGQEKCRYFPLCWYLLLFWAAMCLNLLPSPFSLHCQYSNCFRRSPLNGWNCLFKYTSDLDEQSVSWQTTVSCTVIQLCRSSISSFYWYLIVTAIEANGNVTQASVSGCGECETKQDCCFAGGHGHHQKNAHHRAYYCPPEGCEKVLVEAQRFLKNG